MACSQLAAINFRKLRQDLGRNVVTEGKELFEKKVVKTIKVVESGDRAIKVQAKVQSQFSSVYECELEIDLKNSQMMDASCSCPHNFDCRHIASVIFHLEEHGEFLPQTKNVQQNEEGKAGHNIEKHLVDEYLAAAVVLGKSGFFMQQEELAKDVGELFLLFTPVENNVNRFVDVQFVLRLPFRAKPFVIQSPKQFLFAIQSQEPLVIGQNRFVFGLDSFGSFVEKILQHLRLYLHFVEIKSDKVTRIAFLDKEGFGELMALIISLADEAIGRQLQCHCDSAQGFYFSNIFWKNLDTPLRFSKTDALIHFSLDLGVVPQPHLVMLPRISLPGISDFFDPEMLTLLECSKPGCIHEGRYFPFQQEIKRQHVHDLRDIQKTSIPQALFGTFIENCLPELLRAARVDNIEILDQLVTYPHSEPVSAVCELEYLSGELEAKLKFLYGSVQIPESSTAFSAKDMQQFITKDGILARNLSEENAMVRDLFLGFFRNEQQGTYVAKTEKKIVEFMTEVVPRNRERIEFLCPESLVNQFADDDTKIQLYFEESKTPGMMQMKLVVSGCLDEISNDYLYDCLLSKRAYVVLEKQSIKNGSIKYKFLKNRTEDEVLLSSRKIVVIKLSSWSGVVQFFDEVGVKKVTSQSIDVPLWMLYAFSQEHFCSELISCHLSKKLENMQKSFADMASLEAPVVSKSIQAKLRHYQYDGFMWLCRLRYFGLNGVLADDMGLGKTLQTICVLSHYFESCQDVFKPVLIVCPTSLVENWKEEFSRFNPSLRVIEVAASPVERKKILSSKDAYHVFITSYGLIQRDIELYEQMQFSYVVLDEAQCIKNRETRNARAVKKISSEYRLVLTGTPLENSLADLWSLFDFLMPGFLGTFDHFSEYYIRPTGVTLADNLSQLRKKITPFTLRRMKVDVLQDLPPISHVVYHCHLTDTQQELYRSYAKNAREELQKLIAKEGFDKVRLHVLATLTRLKQICCHPAIFAKEHAEGGDSAKYEMFLDLIGSLVESKKKTVVFSQYTTMLSIMKEDLRKMGIRIAYLDGGTKNRLHVVKQFNENEDIFVFLVSLKAGGRGLNLASAEAVIMYDIWWNPAVEDQAVDRVWRLGQKNKVISYKLVTKDTIEEKIVGIQEQKSVLLKDIVRVDETVISHLSKDEALSLLDF